MNLWLLVRPHGCHSFESVVKHHNFCHKYTRYIKTGPTLLQIQLQTSTTTCCMSALQRPDIRIPALWSFTFTAVYLDFLIFSAFFSTFQRLKISISIILDSRLSRSCSILTLGDSILLVTSVRWEVLHQTAEVERWDRSLSSLCTWQQINAQPHSMCRTTVNPGNGRYNVNKSNRTGWRHVGTFPLVRG